MRLGGAAQGKSVTVVLLALAAIAVLLAAIASVNLFTSSSSGAGTQTPAPSSDRRVPDVPPPTAPKPNPRGGIPFGPPKLPRWLYGAPYTGTKLALTPQTAVADLNAARARSMRVFVILVGPQRHYTNGDGTFAIDRWKAVVDRFRKVDLDRFAREGTIVGHQLVSEAKARAQFGGKVIPNNELDEMARYSESIWPSMPTLLRTDPTELEEHAAAFGAPWPGWRWRHLDAASARYLTRKGSVEAFAAREQASATRQGLALVTGLNALSGGDGSSGIRSPRSGLWSMSPDELLRYGSVMMLRTKPCAFELWRFETPGSEFAGVIYFRRPEITAAVAELASMAARRPARLCRR